MAKTQLGFDAVQHLRSGHGQLSNCWDHVDFWGQCRPVVSIAWKTFLGLKAKEVLLRLPKGLVGFYPFHLFPYLVFLLSAGRTSLVISLTRWHEQGLCLSRWQRKTHSSRPHADMLFQSKRQKLGPKNGNCNCISSFSSLLCFPILFVLDQSQALFERETKKPTPSC